MKTEVNKHPSNSLSQQEAQGDILSRLQDKLSIKFDPEPQLPIDIAVQPDAVDSTNKIVVEVYAHIGKLKGSQSHKIKGDLLKLALIGKKLEPGWRKIMCFACEEAAKLVQGQSWVAHAAREFDVEIHVAPLPNERENEVISAQERQRMVNPTALNVQHKKV